MLNNACKIHTRQRENVHKFENIGHRDLVISMCLDLVSMYICKREVDYEGFMLNHISRRGNYSEKVK